MKNRIYTFFCSALVTAFLLSVGSCSNEEVPAEEAVSNPVPLELSVSGIDTRAVITGTTLPDPCSYGVFVIGADNQEIATNVRVDYANGVSTPATPIYLPDPNVDYQVMAYYPYEENQPYVESVTWGSIENQTDYLFVNQVTVNQGYPKASLHFRHALSRITLRIRKDANNTNDYHLTGAGITGSFDVAYFDLRNAEFVKQDGLASPFVALDSDLSQECVADVLVFPMDLNAVSQDVGLRLWFADGTQVYTPIPRTVWEMGQQYTYEVVINDAGAVSVGEAMITPWENNEGPGLTIGDENYAVPEAVDLGLSVKWAAWNMGAYTPEGYGDYYYWGDPTGDATANVFTSYPSNISGTDYDIAVAKWGNGWRLPTYDEFRELNDGCSWEWTTENGVNGYRVTGNNGNSIFLPVAGGYNTIISNVTGYYMSGSYNDYSTVKGISILFMNEERHSNAIMTDREHDLYSVRPVKE